MGLVVVARLERPGVVVPAVIATALLPGPVQPHLPPGCPADTMGISGQPRLGKRGRLGVSAKESPKFFPTTNH